MGNTVPQFSEDLNEAVRYTLLNGIGSFDAARNACIGLSEFSDVASFSSVNEFDTIISLIESIETPASELFYVGLVKPNRADTDAANFEFVDEADNSFSSLSFVFPWASDQPNNFNGNQNCVVIDMTGNEAEAGTLNDVDCIADASVICKQIIGTLKPTDSPTRAPTEAPTLSPTLSPTHSPTQGATRSPTQGATRSPTQGPTRSPTHIPSPLATAAPSFSPSIVSLPPPNPSKSPSLSPSPAETPNVPETDDSILFSFLTIEKLVYAGGMLVLVILIYIAGKKHDIIAARYAVLKEYARVSSAFETIADTAYSY